MLHEQLARTKDALAAAESRNQQLESRFAQQTLTAVTAEVASISAARRLSKWVLCPEVRHVCQEVNKSLHSLQVRTKGSRNSVPC